MFVRLHRQRHGGREYTSVHLCESYRDPEKGGKPRSRVVYNLGPLDKLGMEAVRKLAGGFRKIAGGQATDGTVVSFPDGHDFGHVYALDRTWKNIGFSEALLEAGIAGDAEYPVTELVRLMVLNRLCDPCSKLALLDWMDDVHVPGFVGKKPSYHHFLRAMDRLIAVKEKAEPLVAKCLLESSGSSSVDLVFYDITSTYFEGDRSIEEDDIRAYGYSRDGRFDRRQITIGVVMAGNGIPLCHHVFPGNTLDKTTVVEVVRDLKERFDLRNVIFVGDRGMLSDENLDAVLDQELGFIVAHPLRRNNVATEVIGELWSKFDRSSEKEQFLSDERTSLRFALAYSPVIAKDARRNREERLLGADAFIRQVLEKLANPSARGRRMTPQGAYDRIRDHLRDRRLLSLYDVSIDDGEVKVLPNRKTRAWEEKIDGMLLVETTDLTSPPKDVIRRYKELAEIERGFRTLKSSLKLRPLNHWTERRIRSHVFICILALQMERWMRKKLVDISVPKAIGTLRRIKAVMLTSPEKNTLMVTRARGEQKEILRRLGVPSPSELFPESCSV
jgi:transposase